MPTTLDTNFDFGSDQLVDLFDELPLWAAPFGLKLLESINYRKNMSALDIGFGAGFPLTEIAMRLGNTCTVYGIDPWEAAIKRTQKKLDFYGITNTQLINGVAENIALPDNSIDLITSNNGLNNVEDIAKALNECSRVAKCGAQLIHTFNLNNTMYEFYEVLAQVLGENNMHEALVAMEQQIYKKRMPLNEFIELLQQNNFKVNEAINDRFRYQFADGTALLNHHFMRMAFLGGWKSIIPVPQQAGLFHRIETLLNQKAEQEGSVSLTIPFVLLSCTKM
jgi:arsenite methyltransferase